MSEGHVELEPSMGRLPRYLEDRRKSTEIDRSRICKAPHLTAEQAEDEGLKDWRCPWCGGITGGVLPRESESEDVDEEWRRALGNPEPIPPGHEALTHSEWITSDSTLGIAPTRKSNAGQAVRDRIFR